MTRLRNETHPWWRKRTIVIPPETRDEWVRLVTWELWMGLILFLLVALGTRLIMTSPDRVVLLNDVSQCYAAPPVPIPCERTLYRGLLNVAFSAFSGFMMLAIASWMVWSLWSAAEPAPIMDDFLRLLSDSFARDWRNPEDLALVARVVGVRVYGARRRDWPGSDHRRFRRALVTTIQAASRADRDAGDLQSRAIVRPRPGR